jgi:gamma-glutamyl:cysteine ligase YbdK (ATP-grasp superfamily)
MINKKKFFEQFKFDQSHIGCVGIEREQFTLDLATRRIIPIVPRYLERISSLSGALDKNRFQFGYELSACQLESKVGPCRIDEIKHWLLESEDFLRSVDFRLGTCRLHVELAPENMPFDIYPDPTGRYQSITANMPTEILHAACRVAGTHVHVGMPDLATAVRVYNKVVTHTDELIMSGDGSSGKRMKLYRVMAPKYRPEPLVSEDEFYERACTYGFVNDPRTCWTLIRISIHGTIEFRMFGATDSIDRIVGWASRCHELCT